MISPNGDCLQNKINSNLVVKMETDKNDECKRFKWSSTATNLLVSIWCHDLIQNQLKISSRNQPIWESIARYMTRKGFSVTGLQCKTRIKNMLYSYYEAVKKNDPSIIEPYYDVFKNVLSTKGLKKTEIKSGKLRQARISEESNVSKEESFNLRMSDCSQYTQSTKTTDFEMEFVEASHQDSGDSNMPSSNKLIKDLENVILKAIDSQTKAITSAIQIQTQMIEKLLVAERERLETIMAFERESRKETETKLDKLVSKLEANFLPQVTYMSALVEAPQNH